MTILVLQTVNNQTQTKQTIDIKNPELYVHYCVIIIIWSYGIIWIVWCLGLEIEFRSNAENRR